MSKDGNKNALRSGVYLSDIIAPWESRKEFEALYQDYRVDLLPEGASQEDTVFDIAVLQWKKRRINRFQQLAFRQSKFATELETIGERKVSGINQFMKTRRIKKEEEQQEFSVCGFRSF